MNVVDEGSGTPIRLALAGFGTVGGAVLRLLQEERDRYRRDLGLELELVALLDRSHRNKNLDWAGPELLVTDSVEEFLAVSADVVVEVLGGTDPADRIIRSSLEQGRAVVTANKLLMARHGADYFELTRRRDAFLGFEASVAGGIPIIRVLRRSLLPDTLLKLQGILNGTCNFILSEMARSGREFQEVLRQAQALGYAEADPSLDVSGRDTRDKLTILAALAFGIWIPPEEIPVRGISEIWPIDLVYAAKLHATIKLLGVAERRDGHLCLRVSPFLVDHQLPLAKISGVLNAVETLGARSGSCVFSGRGAGGNPTAVSVLSDILDAALWKRGRTRFESHPVCPGPSHDPESCRRRESYPFYLRFFVEDSPGIIAALAQILARRNINIDSVVQEPWPDKSRLPFIITVEPTPFAKIEDALDEMKQLKFNQVTPLVLPILRP